MKRSVLIAVFLLAVTAGCGIVDSATPESIPEPVANNKDPVMSADTAGIVTTALPQTSSHSSSAVTSSGKRTAAAVTAVSTSASGDRFTAGSVTSPSKSTAAQTSRQTVNTTSAPAAATQTTPVTTQQTESIDPENSLITCNIKYDGVEILQNGRVIQFIQLDMENILNYYQNNTVDQNMKIAIRDYDFDGYDDIFIPENIGTLNTSGSYWHFDPQSGTFEKWEEMKDLHFSASPDEMDKTLYSHEKISASEYEDKTYRWENGSIVLFKMKKQFCLNDAADGSENIYIDYYEFTNGVKKTVKREKLLFDQNGNYTGVKEIPVEWTLR